MNMLTIIFLLIFTSSTAQTIIIRDIQTGIPLENVNVFKDTIGTTSDNKGLCNLDIFQTDDLITFSLIGYKTIRLPINKIPNIFYMQNESIPMDLINVLGKSKKPKKSYLRLERDVRKVYPYAKTLSKLLIEYDSIIDSLDHYSGIFRYQKKRIIFSKIEKELITKYGYSIKKLTKRQGRILIRLVDRETNRTSYNIIRDFRNIFNAGFWQLTARIFGHNLKSVYNPQKGEDRLIEFIIVKIDNKNRNHILNKKSY